VRVELQREKYEYLCGSYFIKSIIMWKTLRSPVKVNTPDPATSTSTPGKRKLTSPAAGSQQQQKITLTDEDRHLSLEQKLDRYFAKIFEWEPLIQKLEDLGPVQELIERVDNIDSDLERVKKDLIAANIIIRGAEEGENESYAQLAEKVEKVFKALDVGDIDWSSTRRLGKATPGKSRGIQVKLVRQKDKIRILGAKKKLAGDKDFGKVFINPELTKLELVKEVALRKKAKELKNENKNIKFYIKGGRLTVIRDQKESHYVVGQHGEVQPI